MERLLRRVLFSCRIIGLSYLGSDVMACTCAPRPSAYKAFQNARAVFAGTAIGSKDVKVTEVIGEEKFKVIERIFTFKVSESFKGLLKKTQVEISAFC